MKILKCLLIRLWKIHVNQVIQEMFQKKILLNYIEELCKLTLMINDNELCYRLLSKTDFTEIREYGKI